jgi:hypothetical protein
LRSHHFNEHHILAFIAGPTRVECDKGGTQRPPSKEEIVSEDTCIESACSGKGEHAAGGEADGSKEPEGGKIARRREPPGETSASPRQRRELGGGDVENGQEPLR